MKKAVILVSVLLILASKVFSQEHTAEELFNFATMGRPMVSGRFLNRARYMSQYVAGINQENVSFEYMRAIRKETNARVWLGVSALVGGIGYGLLFAPETYGTAAVVAAVTGTTCLTLGMTGMIISASAIQKATLRKDMLIRRVTPIALRSVSIGATGSKAIWDFGRRQNLNSDNWELAKFSED